MKIVIVGCGKVGYTLAKSLSQEKHDIVLVDKSESIINDATAEIDCMGVVGNGAIQSVLLEAQIDKSDFLIACTDSDEINILTCLIARKSSKCKTIARIRNPEYSKQIRYIMNELDIATTINPEYATANEIVRIIRYSSSISSDAFFNDRLHLLKVEVPDNSKIVNLKLYEISKKYNCNVLICVIERGDIIIVPSGNVTVKKGDKIFFVADHQNAMEFFKILGYAYKTINSFMIIGGGKITQYLINILSQNNKNCQIKIIDNDKKICEELATEFPNISVVCADATDKNMLIKEGMNDVDAFISLTGIDEENIILSLFAGHSKNTKVITKVNHLNFIDSLKELDVGSVVNPERVASDIITSYVRASYKATDSNIEALYRISNDRIEAMSFIIKSKSQVTDVLLKDLHIKSNIIIAGIYRIGKIIIPNGFDKIEVGDKVVIISYGHTLTDIVDILEENNEH